MFTSKKALYLDNNFNKISPITNIDSVYFEKATKEEGDKYTIKRLSVSKHLPLAFNLNKSIYSYDKFDRIAASAHFNISNNNVDGYLNTYFDKIELKNPYDKTLEIYRYDTSLFHIDTDRNVDLKLLLSYYTTLNYFNSSINSLKNDINIINFSLHRIDISVNDLESLYLQMYNDMYAINDIQSNPSINSVYTLEYPSMRFSIMSIPENDTYLYNRIDASALYLHLLYMKINDISSYISLDTYNTGNEYLNSSLNELVFHYDLDSSKITYMKDNLTNNEATFDFIFRNDVSYGLLIDPSILKDCNILNNKFYYNEENINVVYLGHKLQNSNTRIIRNIINNEISYCSSTIKIDSNSNNNIIKYSNNIDVNGENNQVYYSTSNIDTSYIKIVGNSNIVINCKDSSILIDGNNNILINVLNQNLRIYDNNIIINDSSYTLPIYGDYYGQNTSLNDCKLFFDHSINTAFNLNLNEHCTIFGGENNDVSVYSDGYYTM